MKMTFRNGLTTFGPAWVVMLAFTAMAAYAGTMSASMNPPVVNGHDIANYGHANGTDKWFGPNETKGQTFTTGEVPVVLKSVTYYIPVGQKAEPIKTYKVRVGKVSGTTFALIYSDTFTQTTAWNGSEYMTWTFAAPVPLAALTTYGVDIEMTTSTTSWQTGIPFISHTENLYPGGQGYGYGGDGSLKESNTLKLSSGRDRVFHIDLQDPAAPGPEPVRDVPNENISLGTRPGRSSAGAGATFEDLVLRGWKRGPPGRPGEIANPISAFFDDRSWSQSDHFEQLRLNPKDSVAFRRQFQLNAAQQAKMKKSHVLLSRIGGKGAVYVNGWMVGESGLNSVMSEFNSNSLLRVGNNVITVVVTTTDTAGNMAEECRIVP